MRHNMTSPPTLASALAALDFASLPALSAPVPTALRPFLTLAYPLPPSAGAGAAGTATLYGKGAADAYTVAIAAVGFTVLREFVIRAVLTPFAYAWLAPRRAGGGGGGDGSGSGSDVSTGRAGKVDAAGPGARARRKEQAKRAHTALRFAEQGWSLLYCSYAWALGIVVLSRLPARFTAEQLWGTYPYTPLPGLTKYYYLTQLGWWVHQVYVLNTEKRRSDHWQMFAHHILTMALIIASYAANYTRIGVVVHNLMDFCDIWLPMAKMLRYLNFRTACDLIFVVFLVGWFITRQVGLALCIRATLIDAPRFIPFAWAPERAYYLTPAMYWAFTGMLSLLLVMCSFWLYTALRVALRVVRGQGAEDERSDGEDDEDGEGEGGDDDEDGEGARPPASAAAALDRVPQLKAEKGLADEGAARLAAQAARAEGELRRRK